MQDNNKEIKFNNKLPIQLRFNDVDIIGHVNNSVYFNFFDLGKTAYFDKIYGRHVEWKNADIVIKIIEADFRVPTFLRDKIEVETAVTRIGNKSITVEQRIIDTENDIVKCVCKTIIHSNLRYSWLQATRGFYNKKPSYI